MMTIKRWHGNGMVILQCHKDSLFGQDGGIIHEQLFNAMLYNGPGPLIQLVDGDAIHVQCSVAPPKMVRGITLAFQ